MELRLQEQSIYLVVLLMSTSSTTTAADVVDVGGKSLSRGTDKGMAYAKFKAHKFSYLNITSIGSDIVAKGSECGLACVDIPSCFSFNLAVFFDINKFICELLPSDIYNNSKKLVASQFHHHYSITSPCGSSPCQNNGMCAAQYEKNSYACVCAKGYTGKHCEMDIDECASNPCLNNGTCTDLVNGFKCSCTPGYNGIQCERDSDECNTNSHGCHGNAVCQNTVGSYKCTCKAGYVGDGKNCNDLDECNNNSHGCHGNADCQNTVGSYKCTCKAGYTGDGKNCYHSVSECNSYNTLAEADRKVTYGQGNTLCDNVLSGWYRFEGAAGTQMPTSAPGENHCGTHAAGWLNGAHPTVADGQVTRQICFDYSSSTCHWSTNIGVRNCGSFYVYNLNSTPYCSLRYCGSD